MDTSALDGFFEYYPREPVFLGKHSKRSLNRKLCAAFAPAALDGIPAAGSSLANKEAMCGFPLSFFGLKRFGHTDECNVLLEKVNSLYKDECRALFLLFGMDQIGRLYLSSRKTKTSRLLQQD